MMSWGKAIVAGLALGSASLLISPQIAQAGVVVSSSGPSAGEYPVGKQVGSSERVTLRAGDTLTVLDNGGTRVFRGAGTFMLSQSGGTSTNRAFSSLTTQRSATRARTGAVRSAGSTEVSNPNLWYVDVATAGKICLPASSGVRLWRGDTQAQSTYSVAGAGLTSSVTFAAGEMLAAWDADTPPIAGTTYTIGHGAGSNAVAVEFIFLDETPNAPEDLAEALIANGCMVQVEQMSNALMRG